MKLTKILTACTAALFLVGCSDKNEPNLPEPTPGADVLFGAALEEVQQTRTIYGEETNNQFPILWLNGDQVKVMSPECSIKEGTYAVSLGTSSTGEEAGTLVKQGDAGVQWGETATANFFSVYPAGHVTSMNPANRSMQCHFIHTQNDYIHNTGNGYTALADMNASFMSAATYDSPNGSSVNLRYKPISTALRFTLTGPTGDNNDNVIISHVRITAANNKAIAGNFTLTFPETEGDPIITVPATADNRNTYNYVDVFSSYEGNEGGGFLTLGRNESIELNAFILLNSNTDITSGWTIEVVLSNGVTFKKTLGGTATAGHNLTLVPGQIHRLPDLPALNIPADQQDYDPSNWMVNIPRNTYLSEISIPGTWNSMNPDFQNVTSLTSQYAEGVRAFHLDTRWKSSNQYISLVGTTCNANSLTGLGVCDGASGLSVRNNDGRMLERAATDFSTALTTITNEVKDDEYMVVMCTFAQDSYVNPNQTWMQAVSEACASNAKVYDARNLTQNTTVGEVLGSVIVIVNCESAVKDLTLPANSKCLFTYTPLTLTSSMFGSTATYQDDVLSYSSKTSSGITLYNTQAQVTSQTTGDESTLNGGYDSANRGYAPSLAQRKDIGDKILKWSLENYRIDNNYAHNHWLYLGLGGYQVRNGGDAAVSGTYTTVGNSMINWLSGKLSQMSSTPGSGQTKYYPVGIVLMNFASDNTTFVDNILQLNNKFQKEYDKTKPAWPTTQLTRDEYNSTLDADNAWTVNQ